MYGCNGNEIYSLVQTVKVFSEDRNQFWNREICCVSNDQRKEVECNDTDLGEGRISKTY